jgi:preprotein translocase subunit SecE
MEVSRYVGFTFLTGFVLLFITMLKLVGLVWEVAETLPNYAIVGDQITLTTVIALALSAGISYWAYQREDYRTYIAEVVIELQKVTWPTWDETKRATIVVIAFSIALSAFLFVSDRVWKYATDLLLLADKA